MTWELKFMEWGKGWWSSPALDLILPWATYLGSHLVVIGFMTIIYFIDRRSGANKKKRRFLPFPWGRLLLLYAVLSAIVYGLKFLIDRPRPFQVLGMARLPRGPGEIIDPGFPSSHSTFAWMMATLLATWFPQYCILFYLLAAFIGWTRVYLFLHFPTDVIAGSLLGYGITKIYLSSKVQKFTGSGFK